MTHRIADNSLGRLAIPAGLEPATPCLEGRCSIRLSYGISANGKMRAWLEGVKRKGTTRPAARPPRALGHGVDGSICATRPAYRRKGFAYASGGALTSRSLGFASAWPLLVGRKRPALLGLGDRIVPRLLLLRRQLTTAAAKPVRLLLLFLLFLLLLLLASWRRIWSPACGLRLYIDASVLTPQKKRAQRPQGSPGSAPRGHVSSNMQRRTAMTCGYP